MPKSITFEVTGAEKMHCEGCRQRVARLLKQLAGVRQVRAKSTDQKISVLFDPALVTPALMTSQMLQGGYETTVAAAPSESTQLPAP